MFGAKELEEKLEVANKRIGTLQTENKELKEAEARIKKEYHAKEKQAMAMMEIEKKEAVFEAKSQLQDEYTKKMDKELQGNFDKLSTSLTALHTEGNATTKYIQELSMKVIDRVSPANGVNLLPENTDVSK